MIAVLTVTQRAPSRVLLIGVAPTGLIVLKCFVTGAHAPAYYLAPLTGLNIIIHVYITGVAPAAPPPAYYLPSPDGLHSKLNIFNNHLNNSNIADCYMTESFIGQQ